MRNDANFICDAICDALKSHGANPTQYYHRLSLRYALINIAALAGLRIRALSGAGVVLAVGVVACTSCGCGEYIYIYIYIYIKYIYIYMKFKNN